MEIHLRDDEESVEVVAPDGTTIIIASAQQDLNLPEKDRTGLIVAMNETENKKETVYHDGFDEDIIHVRKVE